MSGFEAMHLLAVLLALAAGAGVAAALLLPPLRRARDEAASLGARCLQAEAQAARLPDVEAQARDLAARLSEESRRAAETAATLEAERRGHREKLEELAKMKAEIEERFAALAHKALKGNAENFLSLVTERFEKHKEAANEDLARRHQAIETMIKPVAQSLEKFETRIGEIEKAREGAYRAIHEQVRALTDGQTRLHSETNKLVNALRQSKTRGRWGEFQLRQVFEMAGLTEHVSFTAEHHVAGADGARRPDAVVQLSDGKAIVVDAKTPLDAYLNAIEAADDAERKQALLNHVRQVRTQVDSLAGKEYWTALPVTPDFVVMFIPVESAYAAALEHDPNLIESAFGKKVLIAGPTNLIALVKTIAYGWQHKRLAENAQEVADLGRDLFERIKKFGDHMDRLGKAVRQSVERYNDAVGSLETRVLPSARRFEGLGVVTARTTIENLSGVEVEPRRLTAPELLEQDESEAETPASS